MGLLEKSGQCGLSVEGVIGAEIPIVDIKSYPYPPASFWCMNFCHIW
jgi:hypothetical protein